MPRGEPVPLVKPMLATTGPLPAPEQEPKWAFEMKWDGVRAVVYVEDGDVRVLTRNDREVSATYTLPERWTRSRASITVAGRELHTWTDYRGVDPEANAFNVATTALQQEQAVTPPLTRFIVTINVSW